MITKRDIYYRDVSLFGTQSVVDDMLTQLAVHIGVPRCVNQHINEENRLTFVDRHRLHVEAAAKGLLRGPIVITLKDGTTLDCTAHDVLISGVHNYHSFILHHCDVVLVVEKEAVFRSLSNLIDGSKGRPRCVLITGRGCKSQDKEVVSV